MLLREQLEDLPRAVDYFRNKRKLQWQEVADEMCLHRETLLNFRRGQLKINAESYLKIVDWVDTQREEASRIREQRWLSRTGS